MTLTFSHCAWSSQGQRSEQNDRLLQAPFAGGLLVAVMDGVGKHQHAGVAAEAVRRALDESIAQNVSVFRETPVSALYQASARAISSLVDTLGSTTCTALLLLEDGRVAVGHVGDCRAWRCRAGELSVLTPLDQSEEGHCTQALQRENPGRRAASGWRAWMDTPAEPGDVYLLATDGCWQGVGQEELKDRLMAPEPWDRAAEELVRAALAAGSTDNSTAVLVRVGEPRTQP
jgi:protein phosphatase